MVKGGRRRNRRPEFWIPLLYAVVAGAWIYGSDTLVAAIAGSVERQRMYSVYKGFGFVAVTAALLVAGIRWAFRRERRGAQRTVESEALLRAITDAIPDPVYLKDVAGRWIFANPATVRVSGKAAEQLIGRTDAEIFDAETSSAIMSTDRRIMERGVAELIEERVVGPDSDRIFLSSKAPYRDETGTVVGLIGNSRDITDREQAERALRAAEERLRQAQRLDSIGRLAGGVAHDFNNLLTVILSCADSLETTVRTGAPADRGEIAEIRLAGERARDLTQRLLALARKQIAAAIPLDLGAAIASTETLLRRVLGDDIELRADVQSGLWPVLLDPGLLEQVFLNLAINARDAMPEGGTLVIEARNAVFAAEAGARGPEDHPGDLVGLFIRDSGVGISPEIRAHLFEPFFTTKEQGKGTGLGLATVHGIITQAGGHIKVNSAPGKGTSFEIYLPRLIGEVASPQQHRAPSAGTSRSGNETVLVVEDDDMVRGVIARSLRGAGYRVREESSPSNALEYLRETPEPIQLLVTDIQMPGQSGPAMAAEMRRFRPAVRALFVSGHPGDALDRIANGDGFLAKPFTAELLLAHVRSALDGGLGDFSTPASPVE